MVPRINVQKAGRRKRCRVNDLWHAMRCFHDPEGVICHSLGPTLPLLVDVAVVHPAYKPGMTQPYVAFLHPLGPHGHAHVRLH